MKQRYVHETESARNDDELAHRRDRGRRAQRAFRQRQVDTINELQASKLAMQAAITSIAHIASQLDSVDLTIAVRDAIRVAGLENPEESRSFSEGRATSPVHSERPQEESPERASDRAVSLQLAPCTTTAHSQSPPTLRRPPNTNGLGAQQFGHQRGRMSPTLGYGVWFAPSRSLFVPSPPIDIVPYLQGSTSLAATLFWTSLSWGSQMLEAALRGNAEATTLTNNIFGPAMSIKPGREVLDGIRARLIYRKTGSIDEDHPGNKPDRSPRMLAAMARVCEANGILLDSFLTPMAMERLLRSRLGPAYDVIDRTVHGLGSPEESVRVRMLLRTMAASSICFGDGPRWSEEKAETVIEYFARSTVSP